VYSVLCEFTTLNKQPFNLSFIISLTFIHYFVGFVLGWMLCSAGGGCGPERLISIKILTFE
jgi:hypothetical protein